MLQVWSATLDRPATAVHDYRRLLSSDERARALRFHFEHDAARYIVGRAILRLLTAQYLGREPASLHFSYGAHDKPMLADVGVELQFNVAHSDGLVLVAFARQVEIGVDVELQHYLPDLHPVMRSSFAPAERERIEALPSSASQHSAFFRCWTRKEAVLKALGWGLARPLDSFVVELDEARPAVISMTDDPAAADRWHVVHLSPAPGFVGAAAWRGTALQVRCAHYAS